MVKKPSPCSETRSPASGSPVPDLILLDLNLPKKDGREVLAEIKGDPALRRIPVVVLTTSRAEEDVLQCYNMHANCYVIKPIDFERYLEVIKSIEEFWLATVLRPTQVGGRRATAIGCAGSQERPGRCASTST